MTLDALAQFALLAIALAWAIIALVSLRGSAFLPALPRGVGAAPPSVSIIIPARDEQARIATTVRRLVEQTGLEHEVIVVDDRSTDVTPRILSELARHIPQLRMIRIDELPPGWLGKCHAMALAAGQARGRWLLFTDADVWMAPDVVARAIAEAERTGADHLCLLPRFHRPTFWGRATMLGFGLSILQIAGRVNTDSRIGFVGLGAFNLVRAEAHTAIGGHEALRMEVVDDMKLGLLLHRAGFRSRLRFAGDDVEVDWGHTPTELLRVLRKNQFAMLNFNTALALGLCAGYATMWLGAALGPLLALTAGWSAGWAATGAWMSTALPAWRLGRRWGWSPLAAAAAPLTMPLIVVAVMGSMLATLRAGGVNWRGTLYPLAELRRGAVRWRILGGADKPGIRPTANRES